MKYVLAADIGGTNTRIGLFKYDKSLRLLKKGIFRTKALKSLDEPIKSFLREGYDVASCCIGFASPIKGGRAKLTNADLEVDIKKLKKSTHLTNLYLINDFSAIGEGIKLLKSTDLLEINKGRQEGDVTLALGAGTGLGIAYIVGGKAYPSEAGHTTLGIENIDDYALLDYLRKKNGTPVYFEDVISGRGLIDIYDHLEIKSNLDFDLKIKNRIRRRYVKTANIITSNCGNDKLCGMTLMLFTRFYAIFARDAALHMLPSRIYLCGGISPAIKDYLKKYFMKEFTYHRVYSDLLRRIGVYVILNTDVGLIGAASYAVNSLKGSS